VRCHEIGLYFLVELPLDVPFHGDFPGWEGDANLFYRWFDLDELPPIKPSFLVEGVRNPPATTTHAVHRD